MIVVVAAAIPFARVQRARAQTAPATSSSTSSASSASPSGKSGAVPPHLLSSAIVDYPANASGDAVVVLTLLIDQTGAVVSAVSTSGDEPFVTAAIDAAKTWKFQPATRDGKPINAKIRFQVSFKAPVTTPAPPAPSTSSSVEVPATAPSSTPSTTPKSKPAQILEVVVEAEKQAPSVTTFSRAEVRELPGAFGDPFRAIEVMPGVTPIVSGLPFFYVRGSPPGNIGYFVDGVRVPYLYHVGLGPSVIHPGMIDRVDLYSGGYPARYGRYAGGIVSGETLEPRHDTHGEGNVRIFDAGALIETGFGNGKGTVLLGGRYSYTAAIFSLIAKGVTLDYRDYQARITYDLTPKDRVSVFAFGAYDLLIQETNGIKNTIFGSEFYRADLRYDHSFGPKSTFRYAFTIGWDQTRIADARNARTVLFGTRFEVHHAFSDHVLFRFGADGTRDANHSTDPVYADPDNPTTQRFKELFPPRTDLAGGIWADFVLTPDKMVELTPGVRADYFKSGSADKVAVDPRLSMRFHVTDKFRIVHAYGLAHQAPSFVVPVPGLLPGTLANGLQTSFQTSAGVEADLPESFTGTATVFHNAFFRMTDALGASAAGLDNPLTDQRSNGRAIGFELFIRRRLGKNFGGFLSYTLSRSTRTIDGTTFPATFDRTHVASAALAYELGKHWRAGTRLVFYTGGPKINAGRGLITPPPTLSPDRDPAFYRIDVRLEKRWNFGDRYWLAFVIEVLNATFHKETVQGQAIGPVSIPSIGLEGGL